MQRGLLQYFGAFLLCLIMVAAQTSEASKLNEIESNSKSAGDIAINEEDTEKAPSVVSIAIKELKPKEQKDNSEDLSTIATQKIQDTPSVKFGQRSSKVKEEVNTEASHLGEQYILNTKVPQTQINPQLQNPGKAQTTSRNAPIQEQYLVSGKQERLSEGARQPAKRVGYVEVRNLAQPVHLLSDSDDYDDSHIAQHPNIHHMPQSQSKRAKVADFDISYDDRGDECSKSKSKSISEEDLSDDRYPRQSRFRQRVQKPDNQPHHQEYVDDYSYRPQSADEARSLESRERSEEEFQFNGRQRKQFGREQRYYVSDPREEKRHSKEGLLPPPVQRHPDQYSRSQVIMSEGRGESTSENKNSVSKSTSVSKSFSEPRKTQKILMYEKPNLNPNKRRPAVYQSSPVYDEEYPSNEEHRTHQQVNKPVPQSYVPRGIQRGNKQTIENPPRKGLMQHGRYHAAHEASGPPQHESSPPQTHYTIENVRNHMDHHGPRHHHQYPVQDQHPLPQQHHLHPHDQHQHHSHTHEPRQHHSHPHEPYQHDSHNHEAHQHHSHPHEPRQQHPHSHEPRQQQSQSYEPHQHHTHPHEQRQHRHHPRNQATQQHYADQQIHPDSHNERQDSVHEQQQQYRQPSVPVQHVRENKKQRVTHTYQNYDSRHTPSATKSAAQGRNSPAPSYKRNYVVHVNNKYISKQPIVQTRENIDPVKSLTPEDPEAAHYPAQDSQIRQRISSPSIHATPRLPEAANEPQVSVSYSENTYKNGKIEEFRYSPEKISHPDQYQSHPRFFKQELSFDFSKTPIGDHFEKPVHDPVAIPERAHGPRLQYGYTQKAKIQDDGFPSSEYQNSDFGHQSGPQDEHYQHPRDDYESPGRDQGDGVLSLLEDIPDISEKAKIIVAEPVPGKPGVLVADGKKAIFAGNRHGRNPSPSRPNSGDAQYSEPSEEVSKPRERNYGITHNIPGSFAALVNTDPKFLRRLPEMMHSGRDQSGGTPDSEAYYLNSQEVNSQEVNSQEINSREVEGRKDSATANLKDYGMGHEIIQDHGDGVRSVMYSIRPGKKSNRRISSVLEESRTAEEVQERPNLSKSENSEQLQYAKSTTVVKTVKLNNQPDKKTETSAK